MSCEILRDGSLRLVADDTAFVIRRLRPGILLVLASGRDQGQLGTAVATELSAELERFPIKTELFIQALEVDSVHPTARGVWTSWMTERRHQLRGIQILTQTPHMELIVNIAGHHSRVPLRTYTEPNRFLTALREATANLCLPDPRESLRRTGAAEVRTERSALSSTMSDGDCTYEFRSFSSSVLLVSVVGDDAGILASAVFDELRARQGRFQPLHLFVNLCQAQQPPVALSDLWAEWFAANRQRLASVTILSTDRRVSLMTHVAAWRSRTGGLISHLSNPEAFSESLARRVSNTATA